MLVPQKRHITYKNQIEILQISIKIRNVDAIVPNQLRREDEDEEELSKTVACPSPRSILGSKRAATAKACFSRVS